MKADNKRLDKKQRKIKKLLTKNDAFGCFLDAGAGKTRITLTHLFETIERYKKLPKKKRKGKGKRLNALIVSTKANTLDTWPAQLQEQLAVHNKKYSWHVAHKDFKQLTISGRNCKYSAQIIIASFESCAELKWHYVNNYFDFIVIDESVFIKNWDANKTGILLSFGQQCRYRYVLSALPTPNKIGDIYAQIFFLDQGKRLGVDLQAFRAQYQTQVSKGGRMYWQTRGWPVKELVAQTEKEVLDKISDICITERTEEFVKNLTEERHTIVDFNLSRKASKRYKRFETDAVMSIDDEEFVASSGAVLKNKLLQYASGNIYEDNAVNFDEVIPPRQGPRKYFRTNKDRLKALDNWFKKFYKKEKKRSNKVIICYGFIHSIDDIMTVASRYIKRHKIHVVNNKFGKTDTGELRRRWDNNEIDCIVTFAGSIGHGMNLQKHGGCMVFYSMTYNYDHFYQIVRRLKRRGNPMKFVNIYLLQANGTADEDVASNISGKALLGKRVQSAHSILRKIRGRIRKAA